MRDKEKRKKMHCGPDTCIVTPLSLLSARTNGVPPYLPADYSWAGQPRQCNTSICRKTQLSRYTPKKQSHNMFFEKTLVFFSSTTTYGYSLRFTSLSAMDKQPSKRRRLATDTLSYKEDMQSELNRKLPKRGSGSHPVQTAPLTEESIAPVEVQPTSAPTFDGTSNVESQGVNPNEGYDYGACYGGYQSTRFNSSLVNNDKADAQGEWRYNRHRYSAPGPCDTGPLPTILLPRRIRHFSFMKGRSRILHLSGKKANRYFIIQKCIQRTKMCTNA
jgi:hypothetical protein